MPSFLTFSSKYLSWKISDLLDAFCSDPLINPHRSLLCTTLDVKIWNLSRTRVYTSLTQYSRLILFIFKLPIFTFLMGEEFNDAMNMIQRWNLCSFQRIVFYYRGNFVIRTLIKMCTNNFRLWWNFKWTWKELERKLIRNFDDSFGRETHWNFFSRGN